MSSKALELTPTPEHDSFRDQIQAFADWKAKLSTAVSEFQGWLHENQLGTHEIELRIYDALRALASDQLNIAFVAEFSRGKTELINAIFFSDLGRRLLPSDAGRTTMCPTELFYDRADDAAYLRLLPIETRLSELSMSELKADASHWTRLPLDISSPDQVAATCQEVMRKKMVSVQEAEALGLYTEETAVGTENSTPPEAVEIPVWRHAMISFPHPLLKQGLVILDTPGLNALGSEPELTINMLPSAQAVLFVLSADTGVTRSDLDMWQNHITAFRNKKQKGLIAVLNKIDTLWDEMKRPEEVEKTILEQCRNSARLLEIDAANVFPVSAQKGLLAKIRGNAELLEKSNLLALEALLGDDILPQRQQVIWDSMLGVLERAMEEVQVPLLSQLDHLGSQINELEAIRGNNEDIVQQLLVKAKEKKNAYYDSVKTFRLARKKLALQAKSMFATMEISGIDKIIDRTRKDMAG
ncbi:MAG: dynamin family protein, partial [Chromatiales bacterium]|nr:dynamin family protein [Chromatiales bacterium]